MFGTGRIVRKREPVAAPPLPHEVDLVAPPVLTQPQLPQRSAWREFTDRGFNSLAAIALMGVTFATIATLTGAVHRIAATRDVPVEESIVEPVVTTTPQPTLAIVEPGLSVELESVVEELVPPQFVAVSELPVETPEPPAAELAAGDLPPHEAEESGCPAEEATKWEPLLALANTNPAPSPQGSECTWEEVGGTGTVMPMPLFCGGRFSDIQESPTCESGACAAPARVDESDSRSFGTKLVFADNMKEARELAAEQDKLLFVMHVSGNFAIQGFT